jgi:hypothetical protein
MCVCVCVCVCVCARVRARTKDNILSCVTFLCHILHMLLHFAFPTFGSLNPIVVSSNLNKFTEGNTQKKNLNVFISLYCTHCILLDLLTPRSTIFSYSNCIRENVKLARWILFLSTCKIQYQNTIWASMWWVCRYGTGESTVTALCGGAVQGREVTM